MSSNTGKTSSLFLLVSCLITLHARIQRGGQEVPPPLKNYKTIGFLSNTSPDPLKNKKKSTKPIFNIGPTSARQRNAI